MSGMRLSVLVSGRGSNLSALLAAIDQGRCPARVARVLTDRADAPALALAEARGIATQVVRFKDYPDRAAWDLALADAIAADQPQLVVLAGFMRLLGSAVLSRFEHRIINVHPSLLPAFPGVDAPAQALAKGVTLSGCTVHVVDAGVDSGTILAQAAVPVLKDDDVARLHARIQAAEHALLPAVVSAVARGELTTEPNAQGEPPRSVLPKPLFWPPLSD